MFRIVKTRLKWAKKTIKALLEFYHSSWESRNLVKFGEGKEESVKIQKERLLEKITLAYDTKERFFNHPRDIYGHRLFKKTREQWGDSLIPQMQDWLALYEQAIERWRNFEFDIGDYFRFYAESDNLTQID